MDYDRDSGRGLAERDEETVTTPPVDISGAQATPTTGTGGGGATPNLPGAAAGGLAGGLVEGGGGGAGAVGATSSNPAGLASIASAVENVVNAVFPGIGTFLGQVITATFAWTDIIGPVIAFIAKGLMVATQLLKAMDWLVNPLNWVRIGAAIAGFICLGLGIAALTAAAA